MAKMTQAQIKAAVEEQIAQADGYENDELGQMRKRALDYYFCNGEYSAPTAEGRSTLQSTDVADMVEAVTAQMMPAFEGDCLVEFPPNSDQDVQQAEAETRAVNHVIMEVNNGFNELMSAVKDALLLRNGFLKACLDETIDIDKREYENLTEDEYQQLRHHPGHKETLTDVDNGFTMEAEEADMAGFWHVKVTEKTTTRKIRTEAIDPINMSWSQGWDSVYLQECPFVCERSFPRRSDLIEEGYPKAKVNKCSTSQRAAESEKRTRGFLAVESTDRSQDEIETYECYVRMDADGDGIGELMKVVIAGDVLLEAEPTPFVPYASGTPFLQPHRLDGLGLYDKIHPIQDQKTHTLRQWADNQNHANNSRVSVNTNMVNLDDVLNPRPGGVIRTTGPDAVQPFPFTDIGQSCAGTMEYLDKLRSERGGASLDLVTAEAQIAGDTAHGIERQMTAREMMAAMMTRTLSETMVRTLFELTHLAMRLYIHEPITFRVNGEFEETNPRQWPERHRAHVKVGQSNAERQRKKGSLELIIQQQIALYQQGFDGVLVDLPGIYEAVMDWTKAASVVAGEQYFVNPQSEEGQQAQQMKAQQAQQQQQQQQRAQQMLLDLQRMIEDRKADNADAKVFEDARQHNDEMRFKYWDKGQDMEAEEARIMADGLLRIVDGAQQRAEASGSGAGEEAG